MSYYEVCNVRLKHHVRYPHYNQKYPETLAQCFIFCASMMKTVYGYQKSPKKEKQIKMSLKTKMPHARLL